MGLWGRLRAPLDLTGGIFISATPGSPLVLRVVTPARPSLREGAALGARAFSVTISPQGGERRCWRGLVLAAGASVGALEGIPLLRGEL